MEGSGRQLLVQSKAFKAELFHAKKQGFRNVIKLAYRRRSTSISDPKKGNSSGKRNLAIIRKS